MDLKQFKLQLIQQIMQTDDHEILQTIHQILSLNEVETERPNPFFKEVPAITTATRLDETAQELQDSIDEIFNP